MVNRSRDELEKQINPLAILKRATGDERGNQLAHLGDGSAQLGNFVLTPKGLVIQGETSEKEWDEVGKVLRRLEGSIQWLIGDWFLVAETRWGKTYDLVAEKTGYSKKTLYEYVNVARHVEFSIRMENLSFGHHQAVAGFDRDEQVRWLVWAAENQVSISQMRKDIARYLGTDTPAPSRLIPENTDQCLNRLRTIEDFDRVDPITFNGWMDDLAKVRDWLDHFERTARSRLVR